MLRDYYEIVAVAGASPAVQDKLKWASKQLLKPTAALAFGLPYKWQLTSPTITAF